MMQHGRINYPSLDLACPQAKADIDKYVHMFRDRGVNKIKYGHKHYKKRHIRDILGRTTFFPVIHMTLL